MYTLLNVINFETVKHNYLKYPARQDSFPQVHQFTLIMC